jgi:hypothetical protein
MRQMDLRAALKKLLQTELQYFHPHQSGWQMPRCFLAKLQTHPFRLLQFLRLHQCPR